MDGQFVEFVIILLALASPLNAVPIKFGSNYKFEEITLFHDGTAKSVGYQIKGVLKIELLNKDLYLINIKEPKLSIYSTKSKKLHTFVPHGSKVDYFSNNPFLIEVSDGKVKNIFISEDADKGIVNINKAIANLFQFQTSEYKGEETDLNGACVVDYKLLPHHILKTKEKCDNTNFQNSAAKIWGGKLTSNGKTEIDFENEMITSIKSLENYIISPYLVQFIKSNISSKIELQLIDHIALTEKFPNEDIKSIVAKLETESKKIYKIHNLLPEKEEMVCSNCPLFSRFISENREYLGNNYLGTSESASAFLGGIKAARRSSSQDIYNTINSKKNKEIVLQLMDILGAAQTINTHNAALKVLKINTENYNFDLCERYLWALSMTPKIQPHIFKDLQQFVKKVHKDNKLWQTVVLTLAAAVNKCDTGMTCDEVVKETIAFLASNIKGCYKNEQCEDLYIRALSNIHNENTIPILMKIIENSDKKSVSKALKAISKLDSKFWNQHVIKLAEKVLLSDKPFDSSAKVFALDILLKSELSYDFLNRIISVLKQKEKSRELKEYLLQRLNEFSELNNSFGKLVKKIFVENGYDNYDTLGQGGLSTAFSRSFMANGTLSTSQEIVGGILKQGGVNINLLQNGKIQTPFTLGIFAGGLASFMADSENTVDDEVATAGLELTVLGVELRPFVFFSGTGELMGHVWSGTASTLTPAYQALLLLEERTLQIPLITGEVLNIQLDSSASVDLSGKIEISIWNRNAQSLVQNRAGIVLGSKISLSTSYIDVNMNIDVNVEPELHLTSDLDFSSRATLCLKLQQPKTLLKCNIYKSERIKDSKQMAERSRHLTIHVPGRTYSLNAKNTEMCNKVVN